MTDNKHAEAVERERDTAQSLVEGWASVCEGLEAHLQDRLAMGDLGNPASYLSILRSSMANVQRFSEQVRAARWADYRRQNEEIERLRAALNTRPEVEAMREACARVADENAAVSARYKVGIGVASNVETGRWRAAIEIATAIRSIPVPTSGE